MELLHQAFEMLLISALYFFSFSLAQTSPTTLAETINSLPAFSLQKPCAQGCFIAIDNYYHVTTDEIANAIGCQNAPGSATWGAPDYCYCRLDLQSVAQSYLTTCVSSTCTVGASSINISSAGSIYSYYCFSKGYLTETDVGVPSTTLSTSTPAPIPTPAAPTTSTIPPTNPGVTVVSNTESTVTSTTTEVSTATVSYSSGSSASTIATTLVTSTAPPGVVVVTAHSTTIITAAGSSGIVSSSGSSLSGGGIAGIIIGAASAVGTIVGVYIKWKSLRAVRGRNNVHAGDLTGL